MIRHNIKVAFRNLWKYKGQTLISVIGLAVGFACFAMATLWIRYEMTYDSFQKNADQLFLINFKDNSANNKTNGLMHRTAAPLVPYLKKTFPEIANATKLVRQNTEVEIGDFKMKMNVLLTDSAFLEMFGIKVVEGNGDFMIPESRKIAVTQEKARQMFGKESPVGKTVKADGEYTIGAVITGINHSNYPFDMLSAYDPQLFLYGNIVIELFSGIDAGVFGKKLHEHKDAFSFGLQYPENRAMISNRWRISLELL
jgi:hypothetical protein